MARKGNQVRKVPVARSLAKSAEYAMRLSASAISAPDAKYTDDRGAQIMAKHW